MIWDWLQSQWFPAPAALAVIATLGYLVGRGQCRRARRERTGSQQEIARALTVAQELESIANRLHKSISAHVPAVSRFSARLSRSENGDDISWHELCDRADALLKPALRLSSEISHAYSELLQQMSHLSTFAELRTDPLTGVANRRAFDESLINFLKQQSRYGDPLTLAMLDIDYFKRINDVQGHLQGDRMLQELAGLLRTIVRDCDVVARYGGEEFGLLMPNTELHAACNLAERIRNRVQEELSVTVSIGLATAAAGETVCDLLGRADAALYMAKNAGRNCVYLHEGESSRIVGIKSPDKAYRPSNQAADAASTLLAGVGAVSSDDESHLAAAALDV